MDGFEADRAVVVGSAAHHLGRVLRAEPGQLYELSDGNSVRLAKIESSGRDRVELGNAGRVQWVSGAPGAAPAYAGTDFIITRDGRIAAVYLFFDKLP